MTTAYKWLRAVAPSEFTGELLLPSHMSGPPSRAADLHVLLIVPMGNLHVSRSWIAN